MRILGWRGVPAARFRTRCISTLENAGVKYGSYSPRELTATAGAVRGSGPRLAPLLLPRPLHLGSLEVQPCPVRNRPERREWVQSWRRGNRDLECGRLIDHSATTPRSSARY